MCALKLTQKPYVNTLCGQYARALGG